jgi:hypothetical protein
MVTVQLDGQTRRRLSEFLHDRAGEAVVVVHGGGHVGGGGDGWKEGYQDGRLYAASSYIGNPVRALSRDWVVVMNAYSATSPSSFLDSLLSSASPSQNAAVSRRLRNRHIPIHNSKGMSLPFPQYPPADPVAGCRRITQHRQDIRRYMQSRSRGCGIQDQPRHPGGSKVYEACKEDDNDAAGYRLCAAGVECSGV